MTDYCGTTKKSDKIHDVKQATYLTVFLRLVVGNDDVGMGVQVLRRITAVRGLLEDVIPRIRRGGPLCAGKIKVFVRLQRCQHVKRSKGTEHTYKLR